MQLLSNSYWNQYRVTSSVTSKKYFKDCQIFKYGLGQVTIVFVTKSEWTTLICVTLLIIYIVYYICSNTIVQQIDKRFYAYCKWFIDKVLAGHLTQTKRCINYAPFFRKLKMKQGRKVWLDLWKAKHLQLIISRLKRWKLTSFVSLDIFHQKWRKIASPIYLDLILHIRPLYLVWSLL